MDRRRPEVVPLFCKITVYMPAVSDYSSLNETQYLGDTQMNMSIYTDTFTYADAKLAKQLLLDEGLTATNIFPVIQTSKCTVDPLTLEVWQVQVEITPPSSCKTQEDFVEFIGKMQEKVRSV